MGEADCRARSIQGKGAFEGVPGAGLQNVRESGKQVQGTISQPVVALQAQEEHVGCHVGGKLTTLAVFASASHGHFSAPAVPESRDVSEKSHSSFTAACVQHLAGLAAWRHACPCASVSYFKRFDRSSKGRV